MSAKHPADMQRAVALMAKTQGRLVARIAAMEDKHLRAIMAMRARIEVLEVALSLGAALPVEAARPAARDALPTDDERRQIISAATAAAEETGVPIQMILSASRRPPVVRARWRAMDRAAASGMSVAAIARALGKDHTTVMHGLRQARAEGGAQ